MLFATPIGSFPERVGASSERGRTTTMLVSFALLLAFGVLAAPCVLIGMVAAWEQLALLGV